MRAIDADGHVSEPDSIWTEYLPASLHALAPRRVHDSEGRSRQLIGGELKEFIPMGADWGKRGLGDFTRHDECPDTSIPGVLGSGTLARCDDQPDGVFRRDDRGFFLA